MKLTARAGLLGALLLAILAAPAAAASWMSIGAGDLSPEDRATAAYGAVSLPDGGYAWIEMSEPSEGWEGLVWTAEPQYWRVVRANAAGEIIWRSDEYTWQRTGITVGSLGSSRGEPWYDPKLLILTNGNLLAYDSVPQKTSFTVYSPGGTSPPRSWIREIDVETGGTVWEQDIVGWAITGLAERPDGGYWAAAVCGGVWTKGWTFYHATTPECAYILTLGAQGEIQAQWRVHTEARKYHSLSHVFGMAPVAGSGGEYWLFGWKSRSNWAESSKRPYYDSRLRPQIDRIDPSAHTDVQICPETYNLIDGGTVPRVNSGIELAVGYFWGLPTAPMRLAATQDGGALITYGYIGWGHQAYLTRISPAGGVTWKINPVSPVSGAEIPVMDVIEVADGSILAMMQDGDLIRLSRLSSAGEVQQSVLIGDPTGVTTGQRLTAAPSEGHPYGCIISGSTSGFGAEGEQALVVYMEDLEDLIWLGSGTISLPSNVAYAAEEIEVTAALAGAAWGNATYWGSVIGENGTLYETWDLTTNESTHTLSIHTPPGNYTVKIQAYCEEYGISQTLAAASLQRLDVGSVDWDRPIAYLGELPYIGYSYIPYDRYSYWVEVRSPSGEAVLIKRLPTLGSIRFPPENMTEFGTYTAEIYPIRLADNHRIPGNTSTMIVSDETWLTGTITDIRLVPVPGARVEVRQPTHPDPEIAGRVLTGLADATGDYEVSGLIPRYPATVTVSAEGYYDHDETIAINVSGRIHYPARLTPIPPPPLPEIGGTAVYPPRNHPAVGLSIILENATTTLTEVSDAEGHFRFPPLAPDTPYSIYARNATGARVSQIHTYALSRGQTVDLLLEIVDESLLPRGVSFSADPVSGGAPLRVSFQATGEDVDSWHWDFGDRSTGAGQSVSHAYGPGLWTVTLTAENYYGVREVVKERLISVSGSGGVPAVAPTRFVIQTYSGQALANVTVTATPLESTGPLSWLLDLFGISGDVDINGTVLTGTTDTRGGIVLPLIRSVKYRVDVTDPARGIDTSITIYPQEDEVLLSVWPQETPSPAGDFVLYAEEEAGDMRVGVRYATVDLARLTFTVTTEGGVLVHRSTSAAQEDDLSYLLDGDPGEVYLYGYVAELRSGEVVRQDQYVRFAAESRPWIDLAPWIPRGVYNWAAIFLLMGFSWTFGRGEIRGALLTIPILAGVLWLIGWLEVSWLLIGAILTLGILVYMRLSEDDLRY